MKLKKVLALVLTSVIALTTVACGGSNNAGTSSNDGAAAGSNTESASSEAGSSESAGADKLVIWTQAADLEQFAEKFTEATGVECETVIYQADEYQTKVQSAILAGEKEPDIIIGEPDMLPSMIEAGLFEDLDQFGAQDYAEEIVDYVWKKGQDDSGVQRAISYQITPAGMYYRRDIADTVFGYSDPEQIGQLFKDYSTILTTAQTLKDAGYRIFASDAEILSYFSGQEAWVVDGTLNVAKERWDCMDLCIDLWEGGYTAYATPWTAPWYEAMSGQINIYEAGTNLWDAEAAEAGKTDETTEVFAYGLPSWGVLTMRDNVKDTSGSWGICSGPASGMGGGTYLGISSNSERKETAWEFVKFCTLNADTLDWWIEKSEGDTVSHLPTLEKHKDDENAVYGGQKLYSFWLEQAEDIDLSRVTEYDRLIGIAWNAAIENIKTGAMTKDDAVAQFYDEVEATYPDLTVVR